MKNMKIRLGHRKRTINNNIRTLHNSVNTINMWEVVNEYDIHNTSAGAALINSHPSNRVSLSLLTIFPRCGPGQGCAAAARSRELGVRGWAV